MNESDKTAAEIESLRAEAWASRTSRLLFGAAAVMVVAMVAIIWWRLSR